MDLLYTTSHTLSPSMVDDLWKTHHGKFNYKKYNLVIQIDVEYSVQSGNKKFDRIYKVVTLLDGNILQFGTLQFGNRNAKIKK